MGNRVSHRQDLDTLRGVVPLVGTDIGGGNVVALREGTAQKWDNIIFKPSSSTPIILKAMISNIVCCVFVRMNSELEAEGTLDGSRFHDRDSNLQC
jgi:hypothetical protein